MADINVDGQIVPVVPVNFSGDDRRDATRVAKSEAGKRASALATADIVSSFIGRGGGSAQTQRNALAVLDELTPQLEEVTGYVTETEIILPTGVTAEAELEPELELEPQTPSLTYELPADVAALIADDDEPELSFDEDDEDDEDLTPAASFDLSVDEDDDPAVVQLKQQLAKEQKRTAHERKLRVKSARKGWEEEAKRVFNASGIELVSDAELAQINADSRKGFFRAVKLKADANKAVAERFAPRPVGDEAAAREQIRAEERARLEQMWGQPAGTGAAVPAESVEQVQRLARARRTGNLSEILKARMFPTE